MYLPAQIVLLGELERGEQAERHRLAMAVAGISGDRLDRVGDRVPEIQDLAHPGVALVLGDDPQLGPRAGADDPVEVGWAPRANLLPQVSAGDQGGLQHLRVSGRHLLLRERLERLRVGDHGRRLVVGADVVLGLGEVDPGLAAVGGVDLRHQSRRHLDIADPALVGRGAEAAQVADHPAAERHEHVLPGHAGARQLGPDDLGVRHRLGLLARHDRHPARQRLDRAP